MDENKNDPKKIPAYDISVDMQMLKGIKEETKLINALIERDLPLNFVKSQPFLYLYKQGLNYNYYIFSKRDNVYKMLVETDITNMIIDFIKNGVNKHNPKMQAILTSFNKVKNIYMFVRGLLQDEKYKRLHTMEELQDFNNKNIVFQNGVLNIESRVFLPLEDKQFRLSTLPYTYNREEQCPLFINFLHEVCEVRTQDEEGNFTIDEDQTQKKIETIRRMMGLSLTTDMKYEKAFILYGPTSGNGKSTLLNILKNVIGSEKVSHVPFNKLIDDGYTHLMLNKTLNICEEIDEDRERKLIPSAGIKKIITGEDLASNEKYEKKFFFSPTAKIIISTNDRPQFRNEHAMTRRFIFILFDSQFKDNPMPHQKQLIRGIDDTIIQSELSGICNFALQGLTNLETENNFSESDQSLQVIKEYHNNQNSASMYLNAKYEIVPAAKKLLRYRFKDIYGDDFTNGYRKYCTDEGLYAFSQPKFRDILKTYCAENNIVIKPYHEINYYIGLVKKDSEDVSHLKEILSDNEVPF